MAQEPNQNREPEPSEPFFPKPKAGTGTAGTVFCLHHRQTLVQPPDAGTVFQEPKPEPEPSFPVKLYLKQRKSRFAEEPPEPKTGTARTVPPPNRNRTEPRPPCENPFKLDRVSFSTPDFCFPFCGMVTYQPITRAHFNRTLLHTGVWRWCCGRLSALEPPKPQIISGHQK